ncbi:hypothetical protein LguiB_027686 [Lonicera macranthoides]
MLNKDSRTNLLEEEGLLILLVLQMVLSGSFILKMSLQKRLNSTVEIMGHELLLHSSSFSPLFVSRATQIDHHNHAAPPLHATTTMPTDQHVAVLCNLIPPSSLILKSAL